MAKYNTLRAPAHLRANDSYTFLMKELEKVDEKILEPLTGTDWPRDMPVITGGGLLESIVSVDVTYASTGRDEDNLIFDATNDIPVVQADMSQSVARCFNFAEYMSFLNMEKLIQCKNGPEPLKSKGLRDSSLFSSVVLIVEKSRLSWKSRRMGAYQHTKPNGHTIPEMNRVTVQWERVIVYRESCDSRLLQSKRPFFGPFWPDVPPVPRRSGLCSTRTDRGNRGGRVGKQKSPALPSRGPETACYATVFHGQRITISVHELHILPSGTRLHHQDPTGKKSSRHRNPTRRIRY